MPPLIGNVLVLLVLAGVVALAVRSLWKDRKAASHCTGDCSRCGGCHSRSGSK